MAFACCLSQITASTNLPAHCFPVELNLALQSNDSFVPYYGLRHPRVVLALSGGGTRGLAQIGVLQEMEQAGILIDGIAGTSMGAIIGGLYAMGYSASELKTLILSIDWNDILQDAPERAQLFLGQKEEHSSHLIQLRLKGMTIDLPSGYSAGQKLNFLLSDLILNAPCPYTNDFDRLPVRYRAVATDLLSGQKHIIGSGSIIDAMRASMAIPLLFRPVNTGSALLADGGLLQNMPVDEARALKADLIIAVDTSSKLRLESQMRAPWEIADQVTTIMHQKQLYSQLNQADLIIKPDLTGISNTDADDIESIIHAGQQAARKILPQIKARLQKAHEHPKQVFIKQIQTEGTRDDVRQTLQSLTSVYPAPVLNTDIQWAGHQLLQKGLYQNLEMRVDTLTETLHCVFHETPVIQHIHIEGNHIIPEDTLRDVMQTRPGRRLRIAEGRQDLLAIINLYREKGYFLACVDNAQVKNGILYIRINEGMINKIKFSGNQKTRSHVLKRELTVKTDRPLHGPALQQSLINLYSTGFFQSVRFDIQPDRDNTILVILLEEQGNTLLRTGFRYDLERQSKGSFQFLDDNLMGYGIKGSLKAIWGLRDESLTAYLRTDRLMSSYLTYKLGVSLESHDYTHYHQLSDSGEYKQEQLFSYISIGQQMKRLGTLSVKFQTEKQFLKPITSTMVPHRDYDIRSLTLRSEVDSRDRYSFPRNGNYHVLEYESALEFLGGDIFYTRFSSHTEFYYPAAPGLVLHPRIAWGTANKSTPFIKQYRIGGLHSFIGLPENALVGKRYLTANTELRYKIPAVGWIDTYLSLRYDFGGMWDSYLKIESDDFQDGFGVLLSFRTLFGPFQFGWGRFNEEKETWYFSAGHAF